MNFDFDSQTRRHLGYQLIEIVDKFFNSLPDRPVQPAAEHRMYPDHRGSIPETGEDPQQVLAQIAVELVDNGFHIPSAHYLGMMNPTPTYMAVLADALVSALNPQLATLERSQTASRIEAETVRWIGELLGWRSACCGTFTTGGNEANLSALGMALSAHFPETIDAGIASIGAQRVFYASVEAHHSLDKSASLLGMGRKALRRIPVDERLQLDVRRLEETIREDLNNGHKPFCVVATAGTTSSGAIDNIRELHEICQRYNLWFHVDGAYGAAVIFSTQHRALMSGTELADSVTLDPHKWLAMPFASGLLLTRHSEILERTFAVACPYLGKAVEGTLPDNRNISAQWSRRMNSLKLWMTLRVHGRRAYEEMIDRQMILALGFAEWVAKSEYFELAAPQVLPILNLRVKPQYRGVKDLSALHSSIIEAVNRSGQRWISAATVNGESVIRTMVISYLTEERHVEELEFALIDAGHRVLQRQPVPLPVEAAVANFSFPVQQEFPAA